MKMNSFTYLLTTLIITLLSLNNQKPLKYNQLKAYPNYNEALTMKSQIPTANFTVPWLSKSLFEEDPERKLRLKDFTSAVKFTSYHLTRGEMEQIFFFTDKNHDDLLDQTEWDAFSSLFILPFEACDTNANYLLDPEEFKACFDADPRTKLVQFRRRYEDTKHKLIMDTVSTRGNSEINFSDYLIIRRSLFAWQMCHSNSKYIAISAFRCSLKTAIPNKYQMRIDHEKIYNVGLKLGNDPALIELDYISYLRVLYFAYVFSILGLSHDMPYLEKNQFIKATREDRFPTNFEESEINLLYDLINTNPTVLNSSEIKMNFDTFAFFYNLHRLFNKYSIERPLQLKEDELMNLLNDPLAPLTAILSIDASKSNYTESQYLEVTMVLQKLRLSENDFYNSFVEQDASVSTAATFDKNTTFSNFYDKKVNISNRHFFFTTMTGMDKKYWNKEIFYRAFQLANLFTELTSQHDKRFLVPGGTFIDKLPAAYETVNPPINMQNRNIYSVYKNIPREIYLDLLTFLCLENFYYKFSLGKSGSAQLINETLLKMILKDYGMENMPDTVIDLGKKGYDSLRRRMYIPAEVIKYLIIIQANAGENQRNSDYLAEFGLKENTDDSRKFPGPSRRFMGSPLV